MQPYIAHHVAPLVLDERLRRIRLERAVQAASAGDGAAWAALLERFAARLRAVARAHRLTPHDAEDVMQTTWLRLLEHIDDVHDVHAVGAWLETTARRESLRVIGAAQRERPAEEDDKLMCEPVAAVDEQQLAAAQDRAALALALKRLPARQQDLLRMLFAEPAPSYKVVSRKIGMPIGALGPTRARGLARLRADEQLASALGSAGAGSR